MNLQALAFRTALLVAVCAPTASFAGSGTVYGRLMFYNFQGNYCPVGRDCTGAKYPESQYQTNLGVSDSKVYLRNMSNQIIGQGTTDAIGNYVINWFDPWSGSAVLSYVSWHLEHKDNRFAVHDAGGNLYSLTTAPQYVSVTNLGTAFFGNASFPNTLANLYNGAWRTWRDSLSQSNRLVSFFGNLEIRAFDNSCPTSCANGILNRVTMDSASAFSPQGRVMHEMGHIASYKASAGGGYQQAMNVYCYPFTGWGCGWSLDTPEWGAATFEEALATFFGDAALYAPNTTTPTTCLSSSYCPGTVFNTEASSGISCPIDSNRMPLNNVRYLWDVYDSVVDYPGETVSLGVGAIADGVSNLWDGFDNNQKNEPYWGFTMDDNDGRSSRDFQDRWIMFGTNTMLQLLNNCGSVGD